MNSSTTTRAPEGPNALRSMHSATAASASSSVRQTMAPLPAASPSALTTSGAPTSRQYRRAPRGAAEDEKPAAGGARGGGPAFSDTLHPPLAAPPAPGPQTIKPPGATRAAA